MHEHGDGVEKDVAAAAEWYRLAANQGLAESQLGLAIMLEDGRVAFDASTGEFSNIAKPPPPKEEEEGEGGGRGGGPTEGGAESKTDAHW